MTLRLEVRPCAATAASGTALHWPISRHPCGAAGVGSPESGGGRAEASRLKNKGNTNVEFVLYPGAPHAFLSDDRRQVYRKEAAEDA